MSVVKLVWVRTGLGLDCRELQLWYRVRLGVRAGVCRVCESWSWSRVLNRVGIVVRSRVRVLWIFGLGKGLGSSI